MINHAAVEPWNDPYQAAEVAADMRLWEMQQAITEYCYREQSRSKMQRELNLMLAEHKFMVVDICTRSFRR